MKKMYKINTAARTVQNKKRTFPKLNPTPPQYGPFSGEWNIRNFIKFYNFGFLLTVWKFIEWNPWKSIPTLNKFWKFVSRTEKRLQWKQKWNFQYTYKRLYRERIFSRPTLSNIFLRLFDRALARFYGNRRWRCVCSFSLKMALNLREFS